MTTIGSILRRLREEQHLTVEQLADKAHLGKLQLYGYEADRGTPSVRNLLKWTRALGASTGILEEVQIPQDRRNRSDRERYQENSALNR